MLVFCGPTSIRRELVAEIAQVCGAHDSAPDDRRARHKAVDGRASERARLLAMDMEAPSPSNVPLLEAVAPADDRAARKAAKRERKARRQEECDARAAASGSEQGECAPQIECVV